MSEELTVLSEKGLIPHHQASTSLTAPNPAPTLVKRTHTRARTRAHTCTHTCTHARAAG